MSRTCLWVFVAAVLGCSKTPDRTSPQGAFARLAPCVDGASLGCVFAELDRDSRWSSQSIWRTLAQTKEIVFSSYPTDQRKAALGIWYDGAQAQDGAGFFEVFCRDQHCLTHLARGFGAVVEVISKDPSTAVVKTTRGVSFPMSKADGQWGYALYREQLQKIKIRVLDRLSQVKQNGLEFEALRRSGTGADSKIPLNKPQMEDREHEPRP